jgi:RND family efflux transporter MFP subunit
LASGQLSASKGNYLNAKAQLSYSEIRSPIDGVVTDRPLFEGELATANQPLLTVMNTSKLIAKAHIAQDEAVQLKVGDRAELNLAVQGDPIKGRVMLISPALDPGSTTMEVWIEAIKPGPALKPGMNVSIEAIAKSVKDALVVPASAVYKSPESGDYVLVAGPDGKAHLAKVKVGIRSKELAEIQSGLKEGDSVITVGGYALPDGTKIKIEAAPPAEGATEKDSADKSDKPDAAPAKKPASKGKE